MAAILQGKCKDCGYKTPWFVGETGAIVLDEGDRAPYYCHDPKSPRIVVLTHPLEQSIEEDVGITYKEAQRAGRYIRICRQCCGSCGHFYESRVLGFPQFALGCWPPIAVAVSTGVAVWAATRSVRITAIAVWILPLVANSIVDLIAKQIILRKKTRIADPFCTSANCPECGSNCPKTRGVLPCPECRKTGMKIEMVAIS